VTFTDLGIEPRFAAALAAKGIREATAIQERIIPLLLQAGDSPRPLFFSSPTGTGKTFAYLLPLLQRISQAPVSGGPRLLILAPTLELCAQIKRSLDLFEPERSALLIGSAPLSRQIDGLKKKKPDYIVGNPARILQLAGMKKLRIGGAAFIVLDEGDRLADRELFDDTAAVLAAAAAGGNTPALMACSATAPRAGSRFFSLSACFPPVQAAEAAAGGEKPEHSAAWELIAAGGGVPENIAHWAFFAEERKKISVLRSLLAAAKPKKALVFAADGGRCGNIVSQLQYHHLAAGGIWGGMDKKARKAAIDNFRSGALSILAASDLACRGLDIEGITHVVALDTGDDEGAYLHRCGRTGRAGRRGIMITIGDADDLHRLQKIEKKLKIAVYPKELRGGKIAAPN
jgi:superfamily II DNA/RNA helicase